ncbi:hypothetical protein G7046_g1163 [Stylonectria norvegica]|nr:hypothetical protein G7046_g1163 [Stylonectria norvegica]
MADKQETPSAPREKLEDQVRRHGEVHPPRSKTRPLTKDILHNIQTDDLQQESIEVAQEAMSKFTIEKDIAQHIKRTFDERKGPTWHCIVGRNFGSFVTHGPKITTPIAATAAMNIRRLSIAVTPAIAATNGYGEDGHGDDDHGDDYDSDD